MRKSLFLLPLFICLAAAGAAADGGGPDTYGYVWNDELPFEWIDPDGGQVLFLGDDSWQPAELGFSFNFYGVDFQSANIVANGYLIFGQTANTYVNQCPLPDPASPNNAIYFYWHDLIPASDGVVSYKRTGQAPYRHFLVTFENVPYFGYPYVLSAQVILTETVNWTRIAYLETGQGGTNATVGIENADGTIGLTALCNDTALSDETSLFFGFPGAENVRIETGPLGLRLLWDDPSGAERFEVESRPFGSSDWSPVGETEQHDIADPNAQECHTYDYRITAFAGEVGRAAPVLSTQTFFPLAPSDLTAVGIGGVRNELFWRDNSSCEDGFVIERKTSNSPFSFLASVPAETLSYTDESPPADEGLGYRVKAKSALLAGPYSNEALVTANLQAVSDLSAASHSETQILLTWTDLCTGENGYSVERKLADGEEGFAEVAMIGPDLSEFLDFGLEPFTSYTYRIRAFVLPVNGPYSNEATAETGDDDTAADDDSGDDDTEIVSDDDVSPDDSFGDDDSAGQDDDGGGGGEAAGCSC